MRLPGFPVDVAPFTRFEPEALALLDAHLQRETFAAGAVLVSASQGDASKLFIVGAGRVRGRGGATGDADLDLGRGALFPVGALSGRRPSANTYVAETEVEAFTLPAEQFHRLLETSPAFSSYCGSYLARLVSESRRQAQTRSADDAANELDLPLSQFIKRAPVVVDETASILRAVETMHAHKTGSVVVTNTGGAPVGILTQSDVVYRVVLARVALECLVSEVMTPKPATLLDTATAADAMFTLAARGVRHLVVVNAAGLVTGVVSEHDLFALQRSNVARARRAVESAPDVPAVARVVRDVRRAATAMLDQGAGAAQLTQFLTSLNDAATRRVLELCLARADLGDARWAWLAFGSEGRGEQTLATDQDNGLVFVATGGDVEATRARLLTFAREVNDALDTCGFARCEGGIMAGNAQWCLSLDEWKARFAGWITAPSPEGLLHASIFFDFRALLGDVELGERLHAHLAGLAPQQGMFLRALAANALSVAPPLGLFRDFTTERDAEGRACVDLKKYGARLFVDAARVLALANGLSVAATRARLSQSARLRGGAGAEVDALIEAFDFVQLLRLRHQHRQALAGRAQDNLVPLEELSSLERRILKEALRQAKDLQVRLKLNYQL